MTVVAAAVIVHGDEILVVRRAPGQTLAGAWEFPGGKVELGESIEGCLQRELLEELGIDCEIGEFVAQSLYDYDHGRIRLVALRARIRAGVVKLTVHDKALWLGAKNLESVPLAPADIPIARYLKGEANGV